jgi:uncharacterized protein YydD (DUF2326 family)
MRLVELASNQKSFRTVRFNESGLSLIVGKQSDPTDKSREHSTNGVGKSLLLYLVSFCLGSNPNKQMKEKLPDWEFTLTFDHADERRTVTRSTKNQSTLIVDGKKTPLKEFQQALGQEVFGIAPSTSHLSFRFLIGLFLRLGKPAYISEERTFDRETPFQSQLRGAYLLGLDEEPVFKKLELREEQQRLESIRSQFKKDSLLRDYFQGDRDVNLELDDLDEEIAKVQKQATEFQVAENYEQMASEAEETRRKWQRARNELNSLESSRRQIEASLTEQPDVATDVIHEMYAAALVELPDAVQKQLNEVNDFHRELVESRARRLTSEKHSIERRAEELSKEITKLGKAKDDYFQFLGTHGALHEYEALHNRLSDLQRRADRLLEFQKLEQECQERTQKNKLEMSQENIRTTEYLKAASNLTDELNDRFRSMARRIWPNHTCGLVVHNNEGENKVRFDIDARIQGDASDGIGESKIFCFDMTVLVGRKNHKMQFIMHDNRLYQSIDPRQCAELFRIAHEVARENDCQYIATLNESNLAAIRDKLEDPSEFGVLFSDNTVLELTDDSDEGKLLGITVDLIYDGAKNREE